MTQPRRKLIVIFGGRSAEHDVSRSTARHVLAAIDPAKYEVLPIGIAKDGLWHVANEALEALEANQVEALPPRLSVEGRAIGAELMHVSNQAEPKPVVFPLLHGPLGEDGTIQGMLELADLPYVGCGVLSSALAMDKVMAKQLFASAGLPQARYVSIDTDELASGGLEREAAVSEYCQEILALLSSPTFFKPANMGSSVGVSKARDLREAIASFELAASYDRWIIAEEAIQGREIELAVLGNNNPEVSVPGEIVAGADFYDYADKYESGTAQTIIPAALSPKEVADAQDMALKAFATLRCEGMARVDLFYEPDGRGYLINEVNTIPGFTPISMYPKLWEASGMPYGSLIERLVDLAAQRHTKTRRRIDH